MKELPLVSIIIPVYNASAYVADAIRSALEQDYERKEIVVVDDGSTDSTPTVLKSFEGRITILHQANAGPGAARNRALRHAKGTYIAFLDADDYWVPGKLRLQVEYLEQHPDIGAVYSKWLLWHADAEGRFLSPHLPPLKKPTSIVLQDSGWIYTKLLFDCRLLTSTVMLRRSIIDHVGLFSEDLLRGQDYDYWLRLSRITQIDKLDCDLTFYRIHGDNIVKKYPTYNYELKVLEDNIARWGLVGPDGSRASKKAVGRHLGKLCFGFGYWHSQHGTYSIARSAFLKSLTYRPTHVKSWMYLVLMTIFGVFCRNRLALAAGSNQNGWARK